MKVAVCPGNLNHYKFTARALIAQKWVLDREGNYLEVAEDSDEPVIENPDLTRHEFTCDECGHIALCWEDETFAEVRRSAQTLGELMREHPELAEDIVAAARVMIHNDKVATHLILDHLYNVLDSDEKPRRVVATMPDDESLKGIPHRPSNSKKEKTP
jgi:hypothetical protein